MFNFVRPAKKSSSRSSKTQKTESDIKFTSNKILKKVPQHREAKKKKSKEKSFEDSFENRTLDLVNEYQLNSSVDNGVKGFKDFFENVKTYEKNGLIYEIYNPESYDSNVVFSESSTNIFDSTKSSRGFIRVSSGCEVTPKKRSHSKEEPQIFKSSRKIKEISKRLLSNVYYSNLYIQDAEVKKSIENIIHENKKLSKDSIDLTSSPFTSNSNSISNSGSGSNSNGNSSSGSPVGRSDAKIGTMSPVIGRKPTTCSTQSVKPESLTLNEKPVGMKSKSKEELIHLNDLNEENYNKGIDEKIKAAKDLFLYEPIYTLSYMNVKTDLKEESLQTTNEYERIFRKYFETEEEKNDFESSRSSVNSQRAIDIEKDYEELCKYREKLIDLDNYYLKEGKITQYEIKKLNSKKDTISVPNNGSISSIRVKVPKKKGERIKMILNKMENLSKNLEQKENNYKSTLKSFIKELENTSSSQATKLIKKVNDFITKETESSFIQRKMTSRKEAPIVHRQQEDLLVELENFKKEEGSYVFEIPTKYQMSNFVKCLKETRVKNKVVKFYENSVVDVIDKHRTIKRIFPDGFEILFFKNKNITLKYPCGKRYYYYYRNKSYEFRFLSQNFFVYKFSSGQYEKHYLDNSKNLKFPNGTYRIFRPNGEELRQFPDQKIQIKDKKGKILFDGFYK